MFRQKSVQTCMRGIYPDIRGQVLKEGPFPFPFYFLREQLLCCMKNQWENCLRDTFLKQSIPIQVV